MAMAMATASAGRGARVGSVGSASRRVRGVAARASVRCQAAAGATNRVFNFSAGPATLPEEVLQQCQTDMVSWKGTGMSIMEMSHRGKDFMGIAKETEADLRTLLGIPEDYAVLFAQGGASTQMASIPLNLAAGGGKGDYVVTGAWSKKAYQEGQLHCDAALAGDGKPMGFMDIPPASEWKVRPDAKFVHMCDNETIGGVEFKSVPDVGSVPLVADMSSNFCSRPVDVKKFGVIYAGAQKNIGPAGVTIVIVRKDLLGKEDEKCPTMLKWTTLSENESMYNTPPCWAIYVCGLVFKWLLQNGGLEAMQKKNDAKAKMLYDAIDGSDGFYTCPVAKGVRSNMNVPFRIGYGGGDEALEAEFIKVAKAAGMDSLKGHRSVGGIRASIYNAMPAEGVSALIKVMQDFQKSHPKN